MGGQVVPDAQVVAPDGQVSLSLCAIIKDERPLDLIEWLQHHKALGFDEFILFDNNETPQVEELLSSLGFPAIVIHQPGVCQQLPAYRRALTMFRGDWCLFLDCDEFLQIYNPKFFRHLFTIAENQISINWWGFGQPGLEISTPGLRLREFKKYSIDHEFNSHVKSFIKRGTEGVWLDPHHLRTITPQINSEGLPFIGPRCPINGLECARIQHIFTGSRMDWSRKIARGRADTGGTRSWKEYETFNASCR